MMERVRILLVSAPEAPVRRLADRLRDPDVDVVLSASADDALSQTRKLLPNVVVVDGSLPGRDVMRLYGRLRSTVAGSNVPLIFSSHDGSNADQFNTSAPDFYLGPAATLEELEQLVFSFLPESLVEVDERKALPDPDDDEMEITDEVRRLLYGRLAAGLPVLPRQPTEDGGATAGLSSSPPPPELAAVLTSGALTIALAYLGVYALGEALAAFVDARLGLIVHAGLLAALFFHGANTPPGIERSFYWTLWLAPLTRIYALAQPFAGAPPLAWWALTTIPMAVAGLVAMRLVGQTPREAGLIPKLREAPLAILMLPIGLTLGVLFYLLLDPRGPARELASGGAGLLTIVTLVVILNPGIVDEFVFRGVVQRSTIAMLGKIPGLVYGSLLYAPVLPVGLVSGGSLVGSALTCGLGLLFGLLTTRTGSILSATVAHASLAVGLFVLAPSLMPSGLAPAESPAAASGTALVANPSPAAKPVPVVSPVASVVAQPGLPGQPGAPDQQAPSGPTQQPGGLVLATPITLAPPGAAGLSPSSPAQAGPPGARIGVVRGTGGTGARLRSQPGANGPIVVVVPENTLLLVFGPDRTVDGLVWRNVRLQNGSEGWIAASFVAAP